MAYVNEALVGGNENLNFFSCHDFKSHCFVQTTAVCSMTYISGIWSAAHACIRYTWAYRLTSQEQLSFLETKKKKSQVSYASFLNAILHLAKCWYNEQTYRLKSLKLFFFANFLKVVAPTISPRTSPVMLVPHFLEQYRDERPKSELIWSFEAKKFLMRLLENRVGKRSWMK